MTLDGHLRRLPLVVSVLLALAIGWQITGLVGQVISVGLDLASGAPPSDAPTTTQPTTTQPTTPQPNMAPAIDASPTLAARSAAIRAAALFGPDSAATPLPSDLGWVLVGVIADSDPQAGRAILGESAATARVHAVGDILPGERRLHAVLADRVLFERAGILEELLLPRARGLASNEASALASAALDTAGVGGGGQWADLLRWQAVIRAEQPAGLRVYPGNNARLFSQAGLQPGDLLVAINGTPLTDPANAEQFLRILTGAPQATLTLERAGRTENILIDLARLALAGPT